MGCQAYLSIGVMLKSPQDLVRFGFDPSKDGVDEFEYNTGIKLVNPHNPSITLDVVLRSGTYGDSPLAGANDYFKNNLELPFVIDLNSRYFPSLIDWQYPDGNGDGLPIDWDEIKGYLDEIRKVIPDAQVILNHYWT